MSIVTSQVKAAVPAVLCHAEEERVDDLERDESAVIEAAAEERECLRMADPRRRRRS